MLADKMHEDRPARRRMPLSMSTGRCAEDCSRGLWRAKIRVALMSWFFSAIPYLLAAGTIALAGFTLIKEWNEYENTWLRRSALIVLIVVGALTFVSLYRDNREKETEKQQATSDRRQAASDIEGLKGQVKIASDAQERNTAEFLNSFKGMSDRVATLQTEVKTEALQKKLATLQGELQKNEKAMAPPPKAELAFTFAPFTFPHAIDQTLVPILETTLPANQDGSVHVEFIIVNTTTVEAIELNVNVHICDVCKYAKEPPGLNKYSGMKDTDRGFAIPVLHAKEAYQTIGLDITPPAGASGFGVSFTFRCNTCVLTGEALGGIVHIAGR